MHDKLLRGRDALDVATKQKIQNLVNGVADPVEKAKIVYRFMQEKTRYISVQVGIGGWEPILATEVDKVGTLVHIEQTYYPHKLECHNGVPDG